MKYKGKIEISKEEMDCLFGWLEKFIKLDHSLTNKVSSKLKQSHKEDLNEEGSEEDEEDSLEWEEDDGDGDSEEDIQEVHEPLHMGKYQTSDKQFAKGRQVAEDLFATWLINFNQEGEQPPRAQIVEDLAKNLDGRELYKYMKNKYEQGIDTTLVIRELLDEDIPNDVVRHMAENFTQVTSILFHQLAKFLKYPNPLDQEEN